MIHPRRKAASRNGTDTGRGICGGHFVNPCSPVTKEVGEDDPVASDPLPVEVPQPKSMIPQPRRSFQKAHRVGPGQGLRPPRPRPFAMRHSV
jgi:hypothetical protein